MVSISQKQAEDPVVRAEALKRGWTIRGEEEPQMRSSQGRGDPGRDSAPARPRWHDMSEGAFQQAIIDTARDRGWLVYHTYNSKRSEPGFPDLSLVKNGQIIMAEVKRQDGKLSPSQEKWLEALTECPGVEVHVWRPSDWDRIKQRLL